jgi:hypothetical protein
VLVFVMLASLLMAVAIPEGFGAYALLFACAYSGLQIGRNAFVVAVTPRGPFNQKFRQILAWSALTPAGPGTKWRRSARSTPSPRRATRSSPTSPRSPPCSPPPPSRPAAEPKLKRASKEIAMSVNTAQAAAEEDSHGR